MSCFFRGGFSYQAPNKHTFRHCIHVAGLGCTIMLFLWSLLIQVTKQIFDHSTHVTGTGSRIRLSINSTRASFYKTGSTIAGICGAEQA